MTRALEDLQKTTGAANEGDARALGKEGTEPVIFRRR